MRSAFAFGEDRQCFFIFFGFFFIIIRSLGKNHPPAFFQNLFTIHFEFHTFHLAQYGGGSHFTFGVKIGDKPACNQVEDIPFQIGQRDGLYPRGNDGVVIGHFGIIKNLFGFIDFGSEQRLRKQFVIFQTFEDIRYFWIHVIAQIRGIHTRIGGVFLFVEALNCFQRVIRRITELFIAFHLQRCKVKQARRILISFFGRDISHHKGSGLHRFQKSLSLFHAGKPTFGSGKSGVAVNGFQFPVRFRFEILNFQLSIDNQCQCRCLHPSDGKYLAVLCVFKRVKPGGIHAQQPVADGA